MDTAGQERLYEVSSFTIYPAIDLRGSNCVRLYKGDYSQETVYDANPVEVAVRWAEQGASYLHVIDLDGAKQAKPVHLDLVLEMMKASQLAVQLGGGIRDYDTAMRILDSGISRIILGSSVLKNPSFVKAILEEASDRVIVGMDCRAAKLAIEAWLEDSEVNAIDLALELKAHGLKRVNYTDITRDGTLEGPNTEETLAFAKATGISTIASGGVSCIADVKRLLELRAQNASVDGVIIGKALYSGNINPKELFELAVN